MRSQIRINIVVNAIYIKQLRKKWQRTQAKDFRKFTLQQAWRQHHSANVNERACVCVCVLSAVQSELQSQLLSMIRLVACLAAAVVAKIYCRCRAPPRHHSVAPLLHPLWPETLNECRPKFTLYKMFPDFHCSLRQSVYIVDLCRCSGACGACGTYTHE